jgi:lactoylglutathione lyase
LDADRYPRISLAQHVLRIAEPSKSLPFYRDTLGFTLKSQHYEGNVTYYMLAFDCEEQTKTPKGVVPLMCNNNCVLVLAHQPSRPPPLIAKQPDLSEGYWKIAIAVRDLDIARDCLMTLGVDVDTPRQVADIAYLCHFYDPDGYCIELIQHDFAHHHTAGQISPDFPLGTKPTFSLITLRVKDIDGSRNFYENLLGMRLLSRQAVGFKQFTLYFFAVTDESSPEPDVDHIANREWLWRRPYTVLELQHVWGTESDADFRYHIDEQSGFERLAIACESLDEVVSRAQAMGVSTEASDPEPFTGARAVYLLDPDGYRIQAFDAVTQQ